MLVAMSFFWLPAGSSVDAQNKQNGHGNQRNGNRNDGDRSQGRNRSWNWNRGQNWNRGRKNNHGYKNYGQYRRTQVGNRRYRLHRQYYTRNGTRMSRIVRIFN